MGLIENGIPKKESIVFIGSSSSSSLNVHVGITH
jgi:hypothetical protein